MRVALCGSDRCFLCHAHRVHVKVRFVRFMRVGNVAVIVGSGAVIVLSVPSDNGYPARAPVSYLRHPPQYLSGCFCPLLVSSVAPTMFCSWLNWKFILFYFHPIFNSPTASFPFGPMKVKPDELLGLMAINSLS